MIKIICVGCLKEKYLIEASNEYIKRLKKYTSIEVMEIEDFKIDDEKIALEKEASLIEKKLNPKDYLIVLDIDGKEYTSLDFSKELNRIMINNSNITFLIGSSHGVSEKIKEKANMRLSFSKMTFPHQLFRVVLLEQIYRCFKILNNERYHK